MKMFYRVLIAENDQKTSEQTRLLLYKYVNKKMDHLCIIHFGLARNTLVGILVLLQKSDVSVLWFLACLLNGGWALCYQLGHFYPSTPTIGSLSSSESQIFLIPSIPKSFLGAFNFNCSLPLSPSHGAELNFWLHSFSSTGKESLSYL